MRLLALAVVLILAGCGGSAATPTASEAPASSPPIPSIEPSAAIGNARMCEAFDIVNNDISPAYESFTSDPIDASFAGLAIVTAGADIKDLAEGVEPPELAEDIEEMGQLFQDEGAMVGEGDTSSTAATSFYLEMVERYGSEC